MLRDWFVSVVYMLGIQIDGLHSVFCSLRAYDVTVQLCAWNLSPTVSAIFEASIIGLRVKRIWVERSTVRLKFSAGQIKQTCMVSSRPVEGMYQ